MRKDPVFGISFCIIKLSNSKKAITPWSKFSLRWNEDCNICHSELSGIAISIQYYLPERNGGGGGNYMYINTCSINTTGI